MSTDVSLESSARFYDAANTGISALGPDAEFYQRLAVERGGPVLELGCGTGRVLLPIAQKGIACAGVDLSPAMLEQFRLKAGSETIDLTCAGMERFDLGGRRFALILSAYRAFQHLITVEQQLDCLARVRAHLEPGGLFAFDVFNPRIEHLVAENPPEWLSSKFVHEGRAMQQLVAVTRDHINQILHVTIRFVAEDAGDPAGETKYEFEMRWFWRYELEHLLRRSGFDEVSIYGDFDRSPLTRTSPALVVLAR